MSAQQSTVIFSPATGKIRRRPLREFARTLQTEITGGRAFDVLMADDAELERLNREFRKKPYPTDVLSFGSGKAEGFLGEIAISEDRAAAQAIEHGHSKDCEIRILMLHGVLHLTGLDHDSDGGGYNKMARAERRWRKHFGLPAGLIERACA
ncbi:MAG TPA: rRNA maturation RNase YbeY [Bryobacteraceae bacterium]|nr:rRNA maturation RNase YbeY [Bryobacteraceae bacterium]